MKDDNELPEGWAWAKVSDLAHYVTSGARDWSKYYSDHGVLFVRTEDINSNRLNLTKTARMSLPPGVNPQRTRIEQGDILVTVTGANVGKCAYVEQSIEEAYPSQSVALVKVKDKSLAPYLQKSIIAPGFGKSQLDEMAYGLGRPVLNLDNIRDLRLPIAPLAEQSRIVAKIEELFSDLDAGIAALKRAKANLKRYRASVLKAAVEGKLTEQWRAKHPAKEPASALLARILKERRLKWEADQLAKFAAAGKEPSKNWRDKYVEPTTPDTIDLPELPDGWCWASVDQLGDVQLGRQRSPKNRSKEFPTKYIRAANLTENGLDLTDVMDMEFQPHELETYRLHHGDVLLSEASGSPDQVGKPVVWNGEIEDCCFQNTVIRLRPVGMPSDYALTVFRHYYRSKLFAKVSAGVGINHLSAGKFSALPFPLSPLTEQAQIVTEVDEHLSQIDAAETQIAHGLLRAARLRQSILKRAFEGKLVPQDPKDEPASALLERLRTSRTHDEANGTAATSKRTRAKIKESSGEPRTRIRRRPSSQN